MTTLLKAVWFAGGLAFCVLCWQTSITLVHLRAHAATLTADAHLNAQEALQTQAEFRATLQTISTETQALRGTVETQTAYALIILNAHLDRANDTLLKAGYSVSSSAASIADNVDGVAAGAKQIESQVSDLISSDIRAEFLDCEGLGASCLQNNVFSTLLAVRNSANALEREMPRISEGIAQSAENTAAITKDLRTSPWVRLFRWAKFW